MKIRQNDHVAIMKKSWGLTHKILTGEKTIESRWYMTKRAPWGMITAGDTVYFKNSGEPVTIKATVRKIMTFENLTPKKVKELLSTHATPDGIDPAEIPSFYTLFKGKKYCLLIFLSDPKKVKPFEINKAGFGAQAAWITVSHISYIKRS